MLTFVTKEANPESAESSWTLSVGELLFSIIEYFRDYEKKQ